MLNIWISLFTRSFAPPCGFSPSPRPVKFCCRPGPLCPAGTYSGPHITGIHAILHGPFFVHDFNIVQRRVHIVSTSIIITLFYIHILSISKYHCQKDTCTSCRQVALLELVGNLSTRWHYLQWSTLLCYISWQTGYWNIAQGGDPLYAAVD